MDIFSFAGAVFSTPEKLILVPAVLLFFFSLFFLRKDVWLATLSTLIVFLPFNASLRLDFAPFRNWYDPYIYNIEVNYLVPTVYLSDFLLLVMFLSVGWVAFAKYRREISAWLNKSSFWIVVKDTLNPSNPLLVLLIGLVYASFHFAIHPDLLVFISLTRLLLLLGIINFLLLLNPASLRLSILKNSTFLLTVITLSALFQLLIASQQIIGGTEVGLYVLGESTLEAGRKGVSFVSGFGSLFLRGYGTFPHPNVLGAYFVTIGILSLLIRLISEIGGKKTNIVMSLMYWITNGVITSGILLSFSRSAFVVWCIALMLFLLRRQVMALLDRAFIVISKLRLPKLNSKNFSFGLMNVFGGLFGARDNSVSERLSQYLIGIEILKNNLWFGVGAGSYTLGVKGIASDIYYDKLIKSGISILQPSHNVFLTFLAEHGVIGALFAIAVIFIIVKFCLSRFTVISKLAIFILIIAVSMLVFANLDHYLYTLPIGQLIGLLLFIVLWSLLQVRKEAV